jgi:ABC-type multidrug transport system fused ATPase/permease subunit
MVLVKGKIIEFDTPQALFSKTNGHFYQMVKDTELISQVRVHLNEKN